MFSSLWRCKIILFLQSYQNNLLWTILEITRSGIQNTIYGVEIILLTTNSFKKQIFCIIWIELLTTQYFYWETGYAFQHKETIETVETILWLWLDHWKPLIEFICSYFDGHHEQNLRLPFSWTSIYGNTSTKICGRVKNAKSTLEKCINSNWM